ncbi:hypothetical protein N7463_004928 [Penicillium fimorum]|uniref:Uncharacterized protein n=1 Tax=Penicillium fimorum TaxID=1882269 RepID=A0A9X0C4L8_9EURO|nr:hypothetical protein N7463_004928 [Penicillium fimorum]
MPSPTKQTKSKRGSLSNVFEGLEIKPTSPSSQASSPSTKINLPSPSATTCNQLFALDKGLSHPAV